MLDSISTDNIGNQLGRGVMLIYRQIYTKWLVVTYHTAD